MLIHPSIRFIRLPSPFRFRVNVAAVDSRRAQTRMFDRLLALRGDPVKGLAAPIGIGPRGGSARRAHACRHCDVRELVLRSGWIARKDDVRPQEHRPERVARFESSRR